MEKLIIIATAIICYNCSPKNESHTTIDIKGTSDVDFSIVTVDSCEYIL